MNKAASLALSLITVLAAAVPQNAGAQTSATDLAVNQAVMNQANTILLRQKLADAKSVALRGDLAAAAKDYEDAYALVQQIGSGIDTEKAQTISGLATTRLQLARQYQANQDLTDAQTEINRVLKVDPQNQAALALKTQNEQMIAASRGNVPDQATIEIAKVVQKQSVDAGTHVHNGVLLYEMGKIEQAEAEFNAALKLDPDNQAAIYYLRLTKQSSYGLEEQKHTIDTDNRMLQVEKGWVRPRSGDSLPVPNPYAQTNLIYTGEGRQMIVSKLDRIRLDVLYDGLPLGEVIQRLSDLVKQRDPDKKGINFMINNNNGAAASDAAPAPGAPGAVDPATAMPVAAPAAGGGDAADIRQAVITLNPGLNDVRLADVLDAIIQVSDREHPIKYTIEDYAVVFSPKGPNQPQLYSRTFKVDANTFYQGLESVTTFSFGSVDTSNNGNGTSSGSSGSSGNNSSNNNNNNSNGSNGSGNSSSGATVPVVNVAPNGNGSGGGGIRGGGGGGGTAGGTGLFNGGGLRLVTTPSTTENISLAAQTFFKTLGVDLSTPGKSIFFNDRLGMLTVRGTDQDLDTIERAIEMLNLVAPQVHIKARFIEVEQDDTKALGFDWYLGQFGGDVVAQGGTAPSLGVPVNAANPGGVFPGDVAAAAAANSNPQLLTSGLRNSAPALGTITGIMTDPNFRVVIHALENRSGFEQLAEPEAVTTSGRQTQMRATDIQTIITSYSFQAGNVGSTTPTTTTTQ